MPEIKRTLKRITVRGSSKSGEIRPRRRYRVKIDGDWDEGEFSPQWFGWQFDGYRKEIQLNLIDEVFEIVESRGPARPRAGRPPRPGPAVQEVDRKQ